MRKIMEIYGAQTPCRIVFLSSHSSFGTSITEDCSCILEKSEYGKERQNPVLRAKQPYS